MEEYNLNPDIILAAEIHAEFCISAHGWDNGDAQRLAECLKEDISFKHPDAVFTSYEDKVFQSINSGCSYEKINRATLIVEFSAEKRIPYTTSKYLEENKFRFELEEELRLAHAAIEGSYRKNVLVKIGTRKQLRAVI